MALMPGLVAAPSPTTAAAAAVPQRSQGSPSLLSTLLSASAGALIASVPPSLAVSYAESARAGVGLDASAPAALLAGVAAVAVPVLAYRAFAAPRPYGSVSAAAAFAALSDAERASVLLDIRAAEDVRSGGPDLRAVRKKAVQVAYARGGDDEAFARRAVARCRGAADATAYVLDGLDGNAVLVARLLVDAGFARAFAIKGGVAGPSGWQESELPWLLPRKGLNLNLNLNLDGLKALFSGTENPNLVPATLGAAAAAGIGVAIFAEAETVLQLLGSAAFIQIFAKKFMFADDREKTVKEIQTFLDTKIAPNEFAAELKDIGRALLSSEGGMKATNVASANASSPKNLALDSSSTTQESLPGNVVGQA